MGTAAGGQPFRASRPPPNILRGNSGEIWDGDTQVGVFYRWRIVGAHGEWEGEARGATLTAAIPLHTVRLRFFITESSKGGETLLELAGVGRVAESDRERSGAAVKFVGSDLTVI